MVVLLKDIAEFAGVSSATASQVLNNRPNNIRVSDTTRKKIFQAAKKLNYRPNISARGLRMHKTHTVGIVSYDTNDLLAIAVSSQIDRMFFSKGYRTIVGDAQHDSQRASQHIDDFVATRVDGILLLASSYKPDPEMLSNLRESKLPVVCVGRDLSGAGVQSYMTDNRLGTKLLTAHLISLGYRKIAVIVGAEGYEPDSTARLAGVEDACRQSGMELDPNLIIRETKAGWDPKMGYHTMQKLLARGRPDAVVAFDDCTAYGAIRAISQAGLRVPADIAVAGFDDLPVSAFYNPPLTTVRQPIQQLVSGAVGFLYRWMEGTAPARAECNSIVPELIVRSSCRAHDEDMH